MRKCPAANLRTGVRQDFISSASCALKWPEHNRFWAEPLGATKLDLEKPGLEREKWWDPDTKMDVPVVHTF